jgi:5'(3')-deoxyribonucleotidase
MSSPTIMFDMDGVLTEFVRAFRKKAWYHDPQIRVCRHADSEVWDFTDIPREITDEVWREIRASDTFWYDLDTCVTAEEMGRVAALARTDSVYFVTARAGRGVQLQTVAWLEEHGVPSPAVIVSPSKGEMARVLGADYAIDDKAGNAVYTAYHSPFTRSYVLDRPYNQFDTRVLGSKVIRVPTVGGFLDEIAATRWAR